MAFWLRRSVREPASQAEVPIWPPLHEHRLRGYTEVHYISGFVRSPDRLSDVLNRREPVVIEDAILVPLEAPISAAERRERLVVDPFEFDLILGGRLPERPASERAARRIFKVRYPVRIEGTNFEVVGTIHLFPGTAPEFATYHMASLFLPVTQPTARRAGRLVSDPGVDVVLVNRHSIRRIRQLDTPPTH